MSKCIPLVLIILDGWGYREDAAFNAIKTAKTPQWDEWWETCPHILLEASGLGVGLPEGQMGNSEVGHMHIGAGRVIMQDFTRINAAIEHHEFANNTTFINLIEYSVQSGNALHIMGLLSDGGVHSHENHLFAFLNLSKHYPSLKINLHLFFDGRDTSPKRAGDSLVKLNEHVKSMPNTTISSICGRYYAMDRNANWQRLEPLYALLTESRCDYQFETVEDAINYFYQQHITDEFFPPTLIGKPVKINDADSVFFFNFRADRARQLTQAFIDESFNGFQRRIKPKLAQFVSMTHYADYLPTEAAFKPLLLTNCLGDVLAKQGLSQLRLAETEKYAHVTFFFNGGKETQLPREDRVLIPSPTVATYDQQPEMSAPELTKTIVEAIGQQRYDLIVCNYANADMVGHTGNFLATVEAIEHLDTALHTIGAALAKLGGKMLITADHGNAESMFDESTHQAHTAHTSLPVPLLFVGDGWHFNTTSGQLIDIAPTLLSLLSITPPSEMTGHALLEKNHE